MSAVTLSERDGWIRVYTYKDGLLATAAHDLRLAFERFQITLEEEAEELKVTARFWPEQLRVEGTMVSGRFEERGLDRLSRAKIQRTVQREILKTAQHPEGYFAGRWSAGRVEGTLSLRGLSRPLEFSSTRREGSWEGELEISPSRWGIKPYQALFGAIKLQDRVKLSWSLRAP